MTGATVPAVRSLSPDGLLEELARRCHQLGTDRPRIVLVDGAPPTAPGTVAAQLVSRLRGVGRPSWHVLVDDFLRAASLRLEFGRTNPDAYLVDWVDWAALDREVITAIRTRRHFLPALRDARTDRSLSLARIEVPDNAVILIAGDRLLAGLECPDLHIHLALGPAALSRRIPAALRWTLAALATYEERHSPATVADIVVRWNDPARPALVSSTKPADL